MSVATFKQQFTADPGKEVSECLVIDEGDLVLDREMNQSWNVACPRHILLLSAVPKESWNGTQRLCFQSVKGRKGIYLDATGVFPAVRGEPSEDLPELLPEEPEAIVQLAVKKAKEQPVLFWGGSKIYSEAPAWPKDQSITPVAIQIQMNANKFFEELLNADRGFFFIEADDDKDLNLMRGTNFRSRHPKGLCLMLASAFATKSDFL